MKLIIQIPCLNEQEVLPETLKALPRTIPGIDAIEVLVIDDGSSDNTAEIARANGADHIVRFPANQGLARAFTAGIDAALKLGADIIVNTDADNQYRGEDIASLVRPILDRSAEIVIGARDIKANVDFSPLKKLLQRIGSSFVRTVSGTGVPDATSGFRAYSRDAALRLHVLSDFTYTLETIIQAGISRMAIAHVPVRTNPRRRPSRLFSSISRYIGQSVVTVIRIYTMYSPLRVFTVIGGVLFAIGLFGVGRFIYFYMTLPEVQTGHIQSLVISSVFLGIGFQVFLFGLIADIIAKNRRLIEDTLVRVRKMELERGRDTIK